MALIERLRDRRLELVSSSDGGRYEQDARIRRIEYQELKSRLHNSLFDHIDLTRLAETSPEQIGVDIQRVIETILEKENVPLTRFERDRVVDEVKDEIFGLGPLEPLLQDPTVDDILVNRIDQIYVERSGRLEETVARFKDDDHLMRIIDKIVSGVGRRIDETSPMVDARLPDGSRVNAIIPPLALD
ncbi:MAG: CpaF family protein, partial [Myxococcales bacterium]|nr:CpaF family protein [Myxococcales bacterium]